MISQFPIFKKLELGDKEEFTSITKNFLPYSDYNFVSLWSYNTKNSAEISLLDKNLIITLPDYITTEPIFSILGTNNISEAIEQLMIYMGEKGLVPEIKLVPEVAIESDPSITDRFLVSEDKNNHDYILSIEELHALRSNKYGPKRNFINRFNNNYPLHRIEELDLQKSTTQEELRNLFYLWEIQKNKTRNETENELDAIENLLLAANEFNLFALGIYVNSSLVGFSINEILHKEYSMIHFEKADTNYIGASQYLKYVTATNLEKKRSIFINYEQDLGIEGLRKAKTSWHPVHFLKKYTISKK